MRRIKTTFILATTLIAHWVLWMAYTNSLGHREVIAGGLAAAISTLAVAVFALHGNDHFAFSPRETLEGTWQLLKAIAMEAFTRRGAQSSIVALPFAVGGDDPQAAARRALAITYTTITPNTVVLGISHEQKQMLFHQLSPAKTSIMLRRLGARE
jgi:multisubunit Na+/H+ antiporter MnhE subunit